MRRHRFERLVARSLAALPRQYRERIENVAVLVEPEPATETPRELGTGPHEAIYGLYFGVPLTERGAGYGMALPDRIVLYQRAIENACRSDAAIARLIRQVVAHEVAHHFGFDDEDLKGLSQA